jgi:hypothetical protein
MATILARAGGVNTEIPGGLCHFFWEGWLEGEPKKNLRYWPWYILYTGWWFGTMEFYDFPYIGNVIIPTDQYFSEGLKPPTSI